MKTLLLRLRPGQDDDLIRWLEQMDGRPYGVKSQAVKEAIRRGIGQVTPQNSTPVVDLGEIRAVVEAAVESALARLEGIAVARAVSGTDQDDETEALLDSLDAALVMRE